MGGILWIAVKYLFRRKFRHHYEGKWGSSFFLILSIFSPSPKITWLFQQIWFTYPDLLFFGNACGFIYDLFIYLF